MACITLLMALPTAPEDRNLPKGPNFLGIVIGSAIAILVILLGTWMYLGHRKSLLPMKTTTTPSQTRLIAPDNTSPPAHSLAA